jgi:murein DD-endopeptidase MepM/ murein hydrolase activator NlpD
MDCVKDKFTITISDVNGIRQFTLHQIIKLIVKWVVLVLFILFVVGLLLLKTFSTQNRALNEKNSTFEIKQKDLEKKNRLLQSNIDDKSNMLLSLNKQVHEIEKIIGIAPDLNSSYIDRVKVTKEKTLEKIEEEKKRAILKFEAERLKKLKLLEKEKLSSAQISLLNRSIPNGMPVKNPRVTSYYGYRLHPISKKMEFHSGIDFGANIGTPIYATADGVVEYAKKKNGYGNYMVISHYYGFKTAYGHLHKYAVKEGDYIKKGDIIAFVGNSGKSTGSHLHYEIRYLNKWQNPKDFLVKNPISIKDIIKRGKYIEWSGLIAQVKHRLQIKIN